LGSFRREQSVDLGDRVLDFAAQCVVRLAQVQEFAFVPRGGLAGAGHRFDPGESALDPVDGAKGSIV
jgi:hypothetical protein